MPNWTDILIWTLTACAAGLLVYWSVALYQILRTAATIPTARTGLSLPIEGAPSVCVVIAAYNEAKVIEGLVRSLMTQDYPNVRFVLALDRCTDDTAAIARRTFGDDPRFVIHEIAECREGWAGKVNALWTAVTTVPGVREADLLLFADADTIFSPGCVRAGVALLQDRGAAMLSLVSTLLGESWYETLIQPAASLELMRQYPIVRANRDRPRRAFANGQFMLFRTGVYRAIGGHEAVRQDLLEDLAFARRLEHHGHRVAVLLADGVLHCRMYSDWASFERGWKRIYIEAANRKVSRLSRSAWRLRAVGVGLPLGTVGLLAVLAAGIGPDAPARGVLWGIGVGALGIWMLAVLLVHRLAHAPLWSIVLYPVGAWITSGILARSARELRVGIPVSWGGRSYVLKPR